MPVVFSRSAGDRKVITMDEADEIRARFNRGELPDATEIDQKITPMGDYFKGELDVRLVNGRTEEYVFVLTN